MYDGQSVILRTVLVFTYEYSSYTTPFNYK